MAAIEKAPRYTIWRLPIYPSATATGNDSTDRDAAWTPFNPTPMHSEYPSQATCNAVTALAVLESVFGPLTGIPFTATDVRGRTRTFASLAETGEEATYRGVPGPIDLECEMVTFFAAFMLMRMERSGELA